MISAAVVLDLGQCEGPAACGWVVETGVLVGDGVNQCIGVRRRKTCCAGQCHRRRAAGHRDGIAHAVGGGRARTVSTERDGLAIDHDGFIRAIL